MGKVRLGLAVGCAAATCAIAAGMAKHSYQLQCSNKKINDTVGTLALGHYDDEDTVAAVIIGTGTNACYLERTDAIIKSQGLLTTSGGMISFLELSNGITDRGGSV